MEEAIWVEVHMLRRTASGSSYGCRDKHVNLAEECGSPQPLHRMSAKTLHSEAKPETVTLNSTSLKRKTSKTKTNSKQ